MFRPVGAFSLAAAKTFVGGFAPFMRPDAVDEDGDDRLVLAFLGDDGLPVAVRLQQTAERVVADVLEGGGGDGDGVRDQVARILALDIDAGPYEAIADEVVARVRDQHPGLRPVHFPTPYEAATWAVLVQRTQSVQAVNIRRKLAERHGAVVTIDGVDHLTAIPPDEMAVIREVWGVPAVKVPWLRAVARAELEGDLDSESLRAMDPAEAMARLREIDGIGPFGAELILVRGGGTRRLRPERALPAPDDHPPLRPRRSQPGRPRRHRRTLATPPVMGHLPAPPGHAPLSASTFWRRRRESNPGTGLCRPLPKPLGHAARKRSPYRRPAARPIFQAWIGARSSAQPTSASSWAAMRMSRSSRP